MVKIRLTRFLPAVAVGCTGALLGVYVGASHSPVVGQLVTAAFGLFTGVLVGIFGQKREKSTQITSLNFEVQPLSKLVIVFCFANLSGALIGIGLRTRGMSRGEILSARELEDSQLSSRELTKILLIHRTLQSYEVPSASISVITKKLIEELKAPTGLALSPAKLSEIERSLEAESQFYSQCDHSFKKLQARVSTLAGMLDNNVSDALRLQFDALRADANELPNSFIARSANRHASEAVLDLKRPDLDVVLEHVQLFMQNKPASLSPSHGYFGFTSAIQTVSQ